MQTPIQMNKVFKFYNIAIFISLSHLFPELDEGHDIAILKLSEELDLKMYTPACLAKASEGTRFDGGKITVAGWGMTSPNVFPDKPHEVKLTVSAPSRQACALEVHDADSKMVPLVCAGKKEPGKGTCDVSYIQTFHVQHLFGYCRGTAGDQAPTSRRTNIF